MKIRLNKTQKVLIKIIIVLCAIDIVFVLLLPNSAEKSVIDVEKKQSIEDEVLIENDNNNSEEDDVITGYEVLKDEFNNNRTINEDYVGQLFFESKLIDLPVVQGETNDTYLRTDWKTMQYDEGGSVFLESSNEIDIDQNIIIYGHNYEAAYDPSISKMFSPLRKLKEKENYEENKIIYLYLGNKLLKYQIVSTYTVSVIEKDGIQYINYNEPVYVIKNYTKEEFDEYISKVKERQCYETGVEVTSNDSFLTLQTCIDGQIDKYVVLAKMIEETEIN